MEQLPFVDEIDTRHVPGLGIVWKKFRTLVVLSQDRSSVLVTVGPPDVPGLVVALHLPTLVLHVEDLVQGGQAKMGEKSIY